MPSNTNEKSPSEWKDFFDSKLASALTMGAGALAVVDGLIGLNAHLFEVATKAVETMSLQMPENGADLIRSAVEVIVGGIMVEVMRKKNAVSLEEQSL